MRIRSDFLLVQEIKGQVTRRHKLHVNDK